ncbi:MAG: carboxypeptidase-like regulatory domain-containing protein, partial [Patescibacteria group bacterium]
MEVTLNNVKQKNKLPLYLPNRAPGTYKIVLSKPGYKSWEKDIVIASNQTTYIKDVTLFKSALPAQILEEREAPLSVIFSPTAKYALLISQDKSNKNIYEVDLYNTITELTNPIFRSRLNEQPMVSWSPFAEFAAILTKQDNGYNAQIFDAGNPDTAPVYSFKAPITNHKWMKDSLGPAVYIQSNNAAYLINSMEKKKAQDIDTNLIDSAPEYSITRSDSNLQVTRIEKNVNKETKTLSTPNFLYNTQTKEWLAWSPWELWTIYPNGTTALLNRTSDKINFVVPLDEYGLLLLASENKITGFNPGYYVTHELFSGGKIDSIGADITNRKIYFLGEV